MKTLDSIKIKKLLNDQPQEIRDLFIKIVNIHAGYGIAETSEKETINRIKEEIIKAAK